MHNFRFREQSPATVTNSLTDRTPAASELRVRSLPSLLGCVIAAATVLFAHGADAQVVPVVANSISTLASGFSSGPAVTDACGNVYVYEGGGTGIVQIQASTGNVTTVIKNPQGYQSVGPALYMDPGKNNLYFPDFSNFYTSHFDQLPIVNCTPGSVNTNFGGNLGNLGNYYYGTARDVAGDAAGNVYFITTSNVQTAIYKETYSAATSTYTDTVAFTWKNNLNWIAADAAGDLFFVDSVTQDVYSLTLNGTSYPTTPGLLVAGSHFSSISGLTLDPQGNLYIADTGKSLVFEVPLENGSLNGADIYAVASVGVPFKPAVDAGHNIYASNYYPGATKVAIGSTTAAATAVGSSGTFSVTYLFNTASTPTSATASSGTSGTGPFAVTGGTCKTGTAQAALSTCTVSGTFLPTAVGLQTAALSFTSGSGTVVTDLAGIGQGAAVTIDPGTVVPISATLTAPSGIAIDTLNNVYVTDTTANTVTLFTSPSSAGTKLSTGTLTLVSPKGVATDPAGDIFIADTGNNRIVEIPVVAGALSSSGTVTLPVTVKAPQGVAVDGNLVIADTGDNTIILVPNINGQLSFTAARTIATGLGGPNAVAFDPNGNLYVTEATNNDLLKFAAPAGSAAGIKVASGFTTPTGVSTDASGSVFVVDSGSGNLDRFPVSGGIFGSKTIVGGSILNPVGVGVDSSGNLLVTDTVDKTVNQVARVKAVLQFGGVNLGSTGTQTSTINSSGNQAVVFSKPDYTVAASPAPGFAVTNDTCTGATVAVSSACSITATYTPPAKQLNAEEDLNLLANGANGSPILQLIGTGAQITPSTLAVTLTSPAGATTVNAAQAVTLTAQVSTGSNTSIPGGTVKFSVNGTVVGTIPVKNNSGTYTAVLNLPAGLPVGNPVIITGTYSGDVINYSSSTATLNLVVLPLSDSVTLALSPTGIYTTPNSAVDDSSVISGVSLTRTGGVVTATIPSATTFHVGTAVSIVATDTSFNGAFLLTAATSTPTSSTLTWTQGGSPANVAAGAGVTATLSARQDLAAGPTITMTATVIPSGSISPSGTVTFYSGTTVLGTASVVPGAFTATIPTTLLRAGTTATVGNGDFITTYNLSAVYSGDSTYAGGTSNAVPISIVAPPSSAPACTLTGSNGSAATCLLNTSGATFTITPTNPTITIATGQTSGTTTLTVNSFGGWSGVLTFTCAGLPAYATCNPFPGTPLVNASTATASNPQTTISFAINRNVAPQESHLASMIWWLSGICGVFLLIARSRLRKAGHFRPGTMLMLGGLVLLLGGFAGAASGCSSGTTVYATPAGSSTVTVTVHAAQLVPGTTTGQVQLQDANVPPFTINLVVQ